MGGMREFKHKGPWGTRELGYVHAHFGLPSSQNEKEILSERASFPQQVQRICIKKRMDAFSTLSLSISISYIVSKRNNYVLGDWFKAKNVP
jgi:hypothetical protein